MEGRRKTRLTRSLPSFPPAFSRTDREASDSSPWRRLRMRRSASTTSAAWTSRAERSGSTSPSLTSLTSPPPESTVSTASHPPDILFHTVIDATITLPCHVLQWVSSDESVRSLLNSQTRPAWKLTFHPASPPPYLCRRGPRRPTFRRRRRLWRRRRRRLRPIRGPPRRRRRRPVRRPKARLPQARRPRPKGLQGLKGLEGLVQGLARLARLVQGLPRLEGLVRPIRQVRQGVSRIL